MASLLMLVVLESVFLVVLVWTIDWVYTGGIAWVFLKLLVVGVVQLLVLGIAALFSDVEPGAGVAPAPARERDKRNFKDLTPLEGCAIDDAVNGKDR